jgi:hypothetical protein
MNRWIALDALGAALERTKKLLMPVDVEFWLKLALVAMLAGILGSTNTSLQLIMPTDESGFPSIPTLTVIFLSIFVAILTVLYISADSNFVYVESVIKGDVDIISYFKEQSINGLKLFMFQLCAILIMVVVFSAAFYMAYQNLERNSGDIIPNFILLFSVIFTLIIAYALIMWLATDFVVPIMYTKGVGVFGGFQSLKSLVKANIQQFSAYAVIRLGLGLFWTVAATSIALAMLIAVSMTVYIGFQHIMAEPTLVSHIVLFTSLLTVVWVLSYLIALITLPVSVFFRYFSLLFLQGIDPLMELFEDEVIG